MSRSSLYLSKTVPLRSSVCPSCKPVFGNYFRLNYVCAGQARTVDRRCCRCNYDPVRGLPKGRAQSGLLSPPKPIPLGMLSELKFTAHCRNKSVLENDPCTNVYISISRKEKVQQSIIPKEPCDLRCETHPLNVTICSCRSEY